MCKGPYVPLLGWADLLGFTHLIFEVFLSPPLKSSWNRGEKPANRNPFLFFHGHRSMDSSSAPSLWLAVC